MKLKARKEENKWQLDIKIPIIELSMYTTLAITNISILVYYLLSNPLYKNFTVNTFGLINNITFLNTC